jgi:molybdopterin molybdotransferase
MDGYAVANRQDKPYPIQKELPAGAQTPRRIQSGSCLRVFTGSALPANCLAVIPQEVAEISESRMRVRQWPAASFIRKKGEDAKRGNVLVRAGIRLASPELAVLAQEGILRPSLRRRVLVSHLAMGKELVGPGKHPKNGQIRDSNSTLIAALLQSPAFQLAAQSRVSDNPDTALRFLKRKKARESQVLLISGGAGPGDHDWGRHLIRKLGFRVLVEGVDLRPGKPLIAARKGRQTLFILPGNPVSHWVTWHLLVRPLLLRLAGLDPEPVLADAALEAPWSHTSDPRAVWWPGHLAWQNGQAAVVPLPLQSSGDASKLAGANVLIDFPRGKENFRRGDSVSILFLEPL